jgi:hypothetical protein
LEDQISSLFKQRKDLDSEVEIKRKKLVDAKVDYKEVQKKKEARNFCSCWDRKHIKKRNISAAAYHGGKLNGVNCHELLTIAMDLFNDGIQPYLLSVVNPDKCEDNTW